MVRTWFGLKKRRQAWRLYGRITLLALLVGWAIFFWAEGWVRGYGGDVVVAIFLYALWQTVHIGAVGPRVVGVGGLALAVEALQLLSLPPLFGHAQLNALLLGSSFDPWDLLAYGVGLGLVVLGERLAAGQAPEGQRTDDQQAGQD